MENRISTNVSLSIYVSLEFICWSIYFTIVSLSMYVHLGITYQFNQKLGLINVLLNVKANAITILPIISGTTDASIICSTFGYLQQ